MDGHFKYCMELDSYNDSLNHQQLLAQNGIHSQIEGKNIYYDQEITSEIIHEFINNYRTIDSNKITV